MPAEAEPDQPGEINTLVNATVMKSLYSGVSSAFVNTIALQPLEVAKTQLQTNHSLSLRSVFPHIVTNYGARGLWRGTTPSLYRNISGLSLFYPLLYTVQSRFFGNTKPPVYASFVIGGGTRAVLCILLCPFTVIKTRFESGNGAYKSVLDAGISIRRAEGWRSLYAGIVPTLVRDIPYTGLHVMFYWEFKSRLPAKNVLLDSTIAGFLSSLFACMLTHPFDVLKTNMQNHPVEYPTFRQTLTRLYSRYGLSSYYAGFLPRTGRKILLSSVTWLVFEYIVTYF